MYGLGIIQGLLVTLKNAKRRPFTTQYPEERLEQSSRFRGQEFTWYLDRCTGCASCAKHCPLGIIKIVTDPDGGNEQDGGSYRQNDEEDHSDYAGKRKRQAGVQARSR